MGSIARIDYEQISKDFGRFGRFQWFVYCLALYSSFVAGIIVVSSVFTSNTANYRCKIAACDTPNTTYNEEFLNFTTPWDNATEKWNRCAYYAHTEDKKESCSPAAFNRSELLQCQEWVYDRALFKRTIVTDFSLTCGRSWLVSLETSAYMLGMLIGSLVIGWLSDNLGRRVGQLVSAGLLLGGCIIGSFAVNYEMYLALRVVAGMGGMGCFQIAFVVSIEYVGPKERSVCGIIVNITFALGESFMGLIAYFVRDWRYMHLAAAAPSVLIISYYWIMPESVRWLLAMKREDEARSFLKKAFDMNRIPTPKYLLSEVDTQHDEPEQGQLSETTSVMALVKSKIILRRTFILFYLWTVCTMVYFGLNLFSSSLSGNVFLNFTAVVLIEIPSYVASTFLIERMGRKGWHLFVYTLAGVACISVPLIPSDQILLIMMLSLTGKFGASAAFASIFLFTGELNPTPYRAMGVGACSMLARIGSILAPFVNSLSSVYRPLPALIFGVLCIFAGFLIFALPETLNTDLPQTIAECEQLGRHQKSCHLQCCVRRKSTIPFDDKAPVC